VDLRHELASSATCSLVALAARRRCRENAQARSPVCARVAGLIIYVTRRVDLRHEVDSSAMCSLAALAARRRSRKIRRRVALFVRVSQV